MASKTRDPYLRNPKKERRDMNASIFGAAIALIVAIIELRNPVLNQRFESDLGLLLPPGISTTGDIPFAVMNTGAMVLFWLALALKYICILSIAVAIILTVRSYTRGEFFTHKTARMVSVMVWATLLYMIGPFLQRMGENWVAADLNLDIWFDRSGSMLGSHFEIWYVLLMVVSMVGVMMHRAARMQEDQEGLI